MTSRLDEHSFDMYSQFGEDGIIDHIFEVIGEGGRVCVEFGAADGISCSNTAALWSDKGWAALLIEPDADRFHALQQNAALDADVRCRSDFVTPSGVSSIDAILEEEGIGPVDFMSIDVDGDDYLILQAMTGRPRVMAVEFNPTVPPHLDIHPTETGSTFGASALALVRLGTSLGYRFIGASYCNVFFVTEDEAAPFTQYQTDLEVLFPPDRYTYAVTDFAGRLALYGAQLPWGAAAACVEPLAGNAHRTYQQTADHVDIRAGFEEAGAAVTLTPEALAAPTHEDAVAKLAALLKNVHPPVVCIDLTGHAPGSETWMLDVAAQSNYDTVIAGTVLGMTRR